MRKHNFVRLCYYKIDRIDNLTKVSRLHLKMLKNLLLYQGLHLEIQYAGVLHNGKTPWILYDYSETKLKDTRRKV